MSTAVPRVAVLAFDAMSPFHLSVPRVVLGETYNGALPPLFDVTVATARPGRLTTASGFDLVVEAGLSVMEEADVVVVPTADLSAGPDAAIVDAVCVAHARGARIVGLCHGAFTVAAAGLLDGRAAVTHWASASLLAQRYPSVQVRSDVLWIDHGDVLTSAGVAAALDCCLHLPARHGHPSGSSGSVPVLSGCWLQVRIDEARLRQQTCVRADVLRSSPPDPVSDFV